MQGGRGRESRQDLSFGLVPCPLCRGLETVRVAEVLFRCVGCGSGFSLFAAPEPAQEDRRPPVPRTAARRQTELASERPRREEEGLAAA
ncbi:MAG: hypothetical protein KGJ23_04535 [Euryarchaeota archaeon]|nr:hypothetical protein [Euryarchaeota archaeon]MDE1835866.1 hypothetical protein [Euryarchaeota archaeon]MDE1882204.1 hypothetical protein [Euryarchaeota archaeon]MDE2044456.1 hypothetical protein [Thermoplasmata archaeon]